VIDRPTKHGPKDDEPYFFQPLLLTRVSRSVGPPLGDRLLTILREPTFQLPTHTPNDSKRLPLNVLRLSRIVVCWQSAATGLCKGLGNPFVLVGVTGFEPVPCEASAAPTHPPSPPCSTTRHPS
jgi:hypothetical protein